MNFTFVFSYIVSFSVNNLNYQFQQINVSDESRKNLLTKSIRFFCYYYYIIIFYIVNRHICITILKHEDSDK